MPKIILEIEEYEHAEEAGDVLLPNHSVINTCCGKVLGDEVYLVLYRGECDDLPIKAFVGRAEAEAYEETLRDHYRGWKHWEPHHPDVEAYLDSQSLDVGTYIDVSVISVPFITGV